jgi:hypothetical protein
MAIVGYRLPDNHLHDLRDGRDNLCGGSFDKGSVPVFEI